MNAVRVTAGAALNLVPVVGGMLATVMNEALLAQVAHRDQAFLQLLADRLNELGVRVEGLYEDPEQLDMVVRAVGISRATNQEEKRVWLANAVANCARESAPGQAQRLRNLRKIEQLLPIHVEMLRFIADGQLQHQHPVDDQGNYPHDAEVLADELPALSGDSRYAQQLWDDLLELGLVSNISRVPLTLGMLELDSDAAPESVPDYTLPKPGLACIALLEFINDPRDPGPAQS